MIRICILFAVAAAITARCTAREPLVVFLVRHAEKESSVADPSLTEKGHQRAMQLAGLLRHAGIQHVHSTDFIRTQRTARPIADQLGLPVQSYSHEDLDQLLHRLMQQRGRHLVVGHSNTTPAVVRLLGGDPGTPIEETQEYDRLYVVRLDSHGNATTWLIRYGVRFATGVDAPAGFHPEFYPPCVQARYVHRRCLGNVRARALRRCCRRLARSSTGW